MISVNNIAMSAQRKLFWVTPYRTGNLANNGISDLGVVQGGIGWTMFGKGTEYGAILNELSVINYTITNATKNKTYTGSYTNKHYKWLDNFAENLANEIPFEYANIKRSI